MLNNPLALPSPSVIGFLFFIAALGACYRITLPVYLKFKRRKEGYGTIFNSYTGAPVDLAHIRLIDAHGVAAAAAVTDKLGHYRLLVAPGEYTIEIAREGFNFPSIFLRSPARSVTYDNIIPSRRIRIQDHGIVTKNIPIDPILPSQKRSRIFKRRIVISENIQLFAAWFSPFVALATPLIFPFKEPIRLFVWITAVAYGIAMARRFVTFKPERGAYGTITDTLTNMPLDRVVIRLFDATYDKHLQTLTTSQKGRYAFLVNAGSYYLLAQKEGYQKVRLNFPKIPHDSYPLATDIRMKRTT